MWKFLGAVFGRVAFFVSEFEIGEFKQFNKTVLIVCELNVRMDNMYFINSLEIGRGFEDGSVEDCRLCKVDGIKK